MSVEKIIVELIGWIGSGLIVLAYLLISINKVNSTSISYQTLNIVGSVMLLINTVYNRSFPSAGLNVIWLFIGAMGIMRVKKT